MFIFWINHSSIVDFAVTNSNRKLALDKMHRSTNRFPLRTKIEAFFFNIYNLNPLCDDYWVWGYSVHIKRKKPSELILYKITECMRIWHSQRTNMIVLNNEHITYQFTTQTVDSRAEMIQSIHSYEEIDVQSEIAVNTQHSTAICWLKYK